MCTNDDNESILSEPWEIFVPQDDTQASHDLINSVTQHAAGLTLNEPSVSTEPKMPCSWSEHERLTGEILNQAAQRAAAETHKNICVYHPTQNHKPSQDGSNIRPDYVIAWSYNGVRKNTAIIDAKDYHGQVPKREYDKICRDMRETKATRGILVLGDGASISESLRAAIEKDGKVDIVQMQKDATNAVRELANCVGKIIDKNFVPDDKRWKTYGQFVSSTENHREQRPNPHGEITQYTRDSTYHHFNYPRKQGGTIDERYEANQDRNKDGDPDMRMMHNKTKQAQEQNLNEDGSEDMRSKEHRERLMDNEDHHLNVDGSLDMRCKENITDTPCNGLSDDNNNQSTEEVDMRQKENREDMIDNQGHHLNVGGSPDMRCQENQEEVNDSSLNEHPLSINQTEHDESSEINTTIPTKNDGTADMRYGVSQDAVESGEINRDEVLSGGSETSVGGTADSLSGTMGSAEIGGGGDGGGPLKADGTPDMRFSANQ